MLISFKTDYTVNFKLWKACEDALNSSERLRARTVGELSLPELVVDLVTTPNLAPANAPRYSLPSHSRDFMEFSRDVARIIDCKKAGDPKVIDRCEQVKARLSEVFAEDDRHQTLACKPLGKVD